MLGIAGGVFCILGIVLQTPDSGTATEECIAEIDSLPAVKTPAGEYAQIYGDLDLVAYLTTVFNGMGAGRIGGQPVAVIPVYTSDPSLFHRNGRVYVSVRYLLSLDETEVRRLLAGPIARLYPRSKRDGSSSGSSCGLLIPDENETHDTLWRRVAQDVERYEEGVRPRLQAKLPRQSQTP